MMRRSRGEGRARLLALAACLCLASLPLSAQASSTPSQPPGGGSSPAAAGDPEPFPSPKALPAAKIRLVERWDFSRYVDGKYQGHSYREQRGSLEPSGEPGLYLGRSYVLEETLRDLRAQARLLEREETTRYRLGAEGYLVPERETGFPSLRGLPAAPPGDLLPGASWIAPGLRAVDPRNEGRPYLIPFLAEYRLVGYASLGGRESLLVTAKFATRHRGLAGDPLRSAQGTHDLEIHLDRDSGEPFFIRDRFDESFGFAEGLLRLQGFVLHFFEGAEPLDRAALARAMGGRAAEGPAGTGAGPGAGGAGASSASAAGRAAEGGAGTSGPSSAGTSGPAGAGSASASGGGAASAAAAPGSGGSGAALSSFGPGPLQSYEAGPELAAAGVELAPSAAGLVLRVADLRFQADSAELLPSERPRLDAVARALAAAEGQSFLVEGHAASVGKAAGELALSGARAKRVVDELVARGIPAARFVYRGLGGAVPLASNADEAGRARNRRVEITILDY